MERGRNLGHTVAARQEDIKKRLKERKKGTICAHESSWNAGQGGNGKKDTEMSGEKRIRNRGRGKHNGKTWDRFRSERQNGVKNMIRYKNGTEKGKGLGWGGQKAMTETRTRLNQ